MVVFFENLRMCKRVTKKRNKYTCGVCHKLCRGQSRLCGGKLTMHIILNTPFLLWNLVVEELCCGHNFSMGKQVHTVRTRVKWLMTKHLYMLERLTDNLWPTFEAYFMYASIPHSIRWCERCTSKILVGVIVAQVLIKKGWIFMHTFWFFCVKYFWKFCICFMSHKQF